MPSPSEPSTRNASSGFLNGLVTFVVILVSGNPAVLGSEPQVIYLGVLWSMLCIAALRGILSAQTSEMAVVVLFAAISVTHVVTFPAALTATIGFWTRLGIAFLAVRVVAQFHLHYVRQMYVLALISL